MFLKPLKSASIKISVAVLSGSSNRQLDIIWGTYVEHIFQNFFSIYNLIFFSFVYRSKAIIDKDLCKKLASHIRLRTTCKVCRKNCKKIFITCN